MEQCLIWTNVATAIVSFALGSALTPKRTQSQDNSVTGAQSAKFSHSISSDRPADAAKETTGRTRMAKRGETKKSTEPKISIPLTTVGEIVHCKKFAEALTLRIFSAKWKLFPRP